MSSTQKISTGEAYERLMEGNRRFVTGETTLGNGAGAERRAAVVGGQSPFATVLTCADSRVPPEHIFDVGLGELFVCRNAGNLLDELILGSIEYAAAHLGCPLICVLGHTSCGACGAAVAAADQPEVSESPNVDDILRRLAPAVMATRSSDRTGHEWAEAVARANVRLVCQQLFQRSRLLSERSESGQLLVMGAQYDLASGLVEVLVPPHGSR